MEKVYIMAVDIGTQSTRAIVFDHEGNQLVKQRKIGKPYYSLQPGWAEVPANQFWEDLCEITQGVINQLGDEKKYLKALAITTNRDNIIPLDKEGHPLRDWFIWVDQRQTPEAVESIQKELKGIDRVIYTLKKSFMSMLGRRSRFNWIKHHEPEIYKKTAKYLSLCGDIVYRLTGHYRDAKGMQCGVLPFEAAKLDWYRLEVVYRVIGVRRDQLPDLYDSGQIMGTVTEQAHLQTGLPVGLPIVAAGGDKQCETLGSGCFDDKQATISYGTMATIALTTSRYVADKQFRFYTWPSSIKDCWNPEFNIYRGYWLVTWFCRQYAKESDFPSLLERVNQRAKDIPAGSDGLFVFPFWSPHSALYPEGKGAVMGWTDHHNETHFYRAILESIAYALRQGLETIEQKTSQKVTVLYVVGGGSHSDVAMQLTADIFNLPVIRLQTAEVSSVGAAISAGVAINLFSDVKQAVKAMVKEERRFTPIVKNVKIYNDIYKNVYLTFYQRELSFFRTLDKEWRATRAEGGQTNEEGSMA